MRACALSFVAPREVRLEEREVGEPGPGDAVVETMFSGISAGSELLVFRGLVEEGVALDETLGALGGTFDYPFRYGYSCVGRVVHSPRVPAVGDVVFAFHPHQDRLLLPADDLLPVPQVEPRQATLFPLVETALQASLDAGRVQHELVVVMGLGAVGLLTAALLQMGGGDVMGVDPDEDRRLAAKAIGVEAIDPAGLDDWAGTRPEGVRMVVEASGRPEALEAAIGILAHEGTALVLSWYGGQQRGPRLGTAFHRRRITLRSSQVSTIPSSLPNWTLRRRRQAALRLLGRLPLDVLATHSFPFQEAPEAFRALDRGVPGLVHAALAYG